MIKKVAASLEEGKLVYGITKAVLMFSSILLAFAILTDIGIWVMVLMGNFTMAAYMMEALIFANLICALVSMFSIYLLIKDNKQKKEIAVWLEDAVIINHAVLKRNFQSSGNPNRIEVKFSYNGAEYSFCSEEGTRIKGYSKFYIWYCKRVNGKAKILYSPTYNKVMLLKVKYAL